MSASSRMKRKIKIGEAARLYESGWTLQRLADRYGARHQAVNKALRKAGVKIRPPHRGSVSPYSDKRDKIIAAFDAGLSARAAGKRFGVPRSVAQRYIYTGDRRPHPRHLKATVRLPNDPAVLAYTAGMIDGEGHIAIRERRYGASLRLAIYSTDPEVVAWFKTKWHGGLVSCQKRKNGWLPMWQWRLWRNADVLAVLVAVRPYMIIKRKRRVAAAMIRAGKRAASRRLAMPQQVKA